jgi:hypothetical protein
MKAIILVNEDNFTSVMSAKRLEDETTLLGFEQRKWEKEKLAIIKMVG